MLNGKLIKITKNNKREGKQKEKEQIYFSLVGDCCYRYSRVAKEAFFNDRVARTLFLKAITYLKQHNPDYDI